MKYLKFALLLLVPVIYAENIVYITEKLEIPLRSDQDFDSSIQKMLVTGTKMTLLERSEKGWVKVKVGNLTGWVTSHYITNDEPAHKKLLLLEDKYEQLTKKHFKINEKFKKIKISRDEFKKKYYKVKLESGRLRKEQGYMQNTFKSALSLENENQKMIQKNLSLKAKIRLLEQNSVGNQDQSLQNWFMVGGFVLFLGALLGAVLPKIFAPKQTRRGGF
jgi:SH3 domain protein